MCFTIVLVWTWYFGAVAIVPLVLVQAAYWAAAGAIVVLSVTGALALLAPPQQDDALVATAGLGDALVPDVLQHEDVLAVMTGALALLAPPQQDDEDDGAGVASGRFLSAFMFGSWVSRTDALSVACAVRDVI